jgi:ApaG protein
MQTLVTNGIRILVESMFVPEQTSMQRNHVVFAYRIHMVNETNDTVQLLLRHWEISDSNGETRAVDGEGVIGKQPVLQPGQGHT